MLLSSWPGLSRPSTSSSLEALQDVDARHRRRANGSARTRGPMTGSATPFFERLSPGMTSIEHVPRFEDDVAVNLPPDPARRSLLDEGTGTFLEVFGGKNPSACLSGQFAQFGVGVIKRQLRDLKALTNRDR